MKKYVSVNDIANDEKYPFSKRQLQHLLYKRKTNGLYKAVRKIGSLIYFREDLFDEWMDSFKEIVNVETKEESSKEPSPLNTKLNCEDFSVRAYNRLGEMNIHTVKDLYNQTKESLLANPRLGKRTLNELEEFLTSFGLRLKEG